MAIANQLLQSGRGISGSAFFFEGMSSSADPISISDRSYRHGENVLNRGGAVRTRPGYGLRLALPPGKLQGATYYRPINGEAGIVAAVSGRLYLSTYPFREYKQLPNIQLYEFADQVWFSSSVKSVERNPDGTLSAIEPKRVLVAQDGGYTRAAFWDGSVSGHSDPTVVSDSEGNVVSAGIPIGSATAWSGDRLWVASGNKLYAGDIADPTSFVENEYAGEGGFFVFDEPITALAEIPSLATPRLIVFTQSNAYQILSGVRDRSLWKTTENFKSTLFPGVGCVGQRLVTAQNGLLWWVTPTGLTNLNAAQQALGSSRLVPLDNAMSISKRNIATYATGALGTFENFLLLSVPYSSKKNTHTWVMDQAADDSGSNSAWAGVWTGTFPEEWVGGIFAGLRRLYYVDTDSAGNNRLWEAFVPDPEDNGQPIPAFVETKTHIDFSPKATGLDLKNFIFAEIGFTDVLGTVEVEVYWAGLRGKYKKLADYTLVSTEGPLSTLTTVGPGGVSESYRSQQRVLRTPEVTRNPNSDCSSCGIESKYSDWLDVGFSLLVKWTGQASLRSYRIFADPQQENGTGSKDGVESGPKIVGGSVCP